MKKLTFTLFTILFSLNCKSQISLENSYPSPNNLNYVSIVNLSSSGYKYLLQDGNNNQIKIYNLNHSLWKTINLSIPVGFSLSDVANVSEELFNLDGSVELSYSYANYSTSPVQYETKIINETGSVLLTIPNCNAAYAGSTGTNGWKLIAWISGGSNPSRDIYSLPGTGTNLGLNDDNEVDYFDAFGLAYPNPTNQIINLEYSIPTGSNSGQIEISDINGNILNTYIVDNTFSTLSLDITNFSTGTYFYKMIVNGNVSETKSFIKQ